MAAAKVVVVAARYLSPTPQFFPTGFDVNVIREASTADWKAIDGTALTGWQARTAKDKAGLLLCCTQLGHIIASSSHFGMIFAFLMGVDESK